MGRVLCDWACHLCPHRKFVCLNDNIDHRKEGAELVSSLLCQNEGQLVSSLLCQNEGQLVSSLLCQNEGQLVSSLLCQNEDPAS